MGWRDDPEVGAPPPAWASDPEVSAAPSAPRSMVDEVGRQVALTGRAAVKGVAAIPGMLADAVTGPINAGLDAVRGSGNGFRFKATQGALDDLMTRAGVAAPENATERVVQDAASAMSGTGASVGAAKVLAKAASPVVQAVASNLAAGPGMQTVSALTGGTAGGVARENGVGPAGQILATLLGGAAPSVALGVGSAAVRGAVRGGEAGRQQMEQNIATFRDAGTTPSVGQATEGRIPRAIESTLAKTPGSAGVMAGKGEAQAGQLADTVEGMVDSITPRATAESAGRAIKEGIQGPGGFVERFRKMQEDLYSKLDSFIPKDAPVRVTRTQQVLADLNADIPGAPNLSKWFKNAKIGGIDSALNADAGATRTYTPAQLKAAAATSSNADELSAALNEGTLPYEAIKKLRTLVGKEMDNPSLVADVPRSKWSALYAALSDDLGDTAQRAGPQAQQAWSRANNYTRVAMKRLDALDPVVSKADPESIFAAATSGTREGASRARAVMQSLQPNEQNAVIGTVLRRMGVATPGKQNELGDAFSSETFLTNWSRLSPEAKVAIFGREGARDIQGQLRSVAAVASNVREGSKVFANPSGTAAAVGPKSLGAAALGALLTGHPLAAAGIAAAPVGANWLARRMTNPDAVKWLAEPTRASKALAPAEVNAIAQLFSAQH